MRYTRNRQLGKAINYKFWGAENVKISEYRRREMLGFKPSLDHTFKWHRDLSHIGFQGKNWVETERSFIKAKGNYKL